VSELNPLMLIACPVASIVKLPGEVFVIAGSALLSVISPLTLKLIVSWPVPAAQVLLASEPLLLALFIAERRLHSVELPGSSVVLTVIVLPLASSPDWLRNRQTGAITSSRTASKPGRTIALEATRTDAAARDKNRGKLLATPVRTRVQVLDCSMISSGAHLRMVSHPLFLHPSLSAQLMPPRLG
jgi:hypothetical protein